MKKTVILTLAVMIIAAAAITVVAQENTDRRQRFQRMREMQQKAMTTLVEETAKLKANMEESTQSMQRSRESFQNMSEEERTKLRETFMKRRQQQAEILKSIELQVAILKGSRQLRTEHQAAVEELTSIKALATEEKAQKTAERLGELITKKENSYQEILKAMGFEQ